MVPMLKDHTPPRTRTGWGQLCKSTLFLPLHSKAAGATQGDLAAFPVWEGGIPIWKVACYQFQFILLSFPMLALWDQCPESSPSLYPPSCVCVRILPVFCTSPCSGPFSVLQVGMTAAYQVGGFGLCVEFGERFCSKLLYFLACKPWEHMAHCLQNADILKLGEE